MQIYTALEGLIAREADPEKTCVLTVGSFHAGNAANIIPDTAEFEGTLRTNDIKTREHLAKRIRETAGSIASSWGAEVKITPLSEVPPLICDGELTDRIAGFMKELNAPDITPYPNMQANASEDFAKIAERVPSAFLYLSAGFPDERGAYSAHNPKVRFNEEVCPIGAAAYVHCAARWLETQTEKTNK